MQYSELGSDNPVLEIQIPVPPVATPPRNAKEQPSIMAAIATMLPAGLDFLDLSDGFPDLGERVAAKSVRRGFFRTLPTAIDFAGIDVVSLCGALEGDRGAAALLSAAATAGVPAICYVNCREFLENTGDGLYCYSIDEFEAEAQAAGMAVALRLLFGKGAIYLLTPVWRNPQLGLSVLLAAGCDIHALLPAQRRLCGGGERVAGVVAARGGGQSGSVEHHVRYSRRTAAAGDRDALADRL